MKSSRPSLEWQPGEQSKFAAKLFEGDFSFYVDAALLEKCRTHAGTMSKADWKKIFDQSEWVALLGVAYGPREMALAYLDQVVKAYPDSYFSWAGALARFGLDVLPLVIAQAKAHPEKALDDLAPLDAPELVPIVAGVLASNAGSKVKSKAASWLRRHAHDAKGATKKRSEAPAFAHVGWLHDAAHSATPLVLGDLEGVRLWKGTDDPSEELARVKVGSHFVVTHAMAMLAPDVFVGPDHSVVLVAEPRRDKGLYDEHSEDDVASLVAAPLVETFGTIDIPVPSGALVIAVAYDAPKGLPKLRPKKALYRNDYIVIPVTAGKYTLFDGKTDRVYKTSLRPSS